MIIRRRGRTNAGRFGLTSTLLIFAMLSFYSALVVYSRIDWMLLPSLQLQLPTVLDQLPVIENPDEDPAKARFNILVMGLDKRPSESTECTRADTFFILSLDSLSDTATVLSFPRDLYIDIPDGAGGTYKQRINTTTVFGCLNDYPGGGPGLAKDTLKLNFGIDISYHAIIDLEGFQELIDSLGGIDINVPERLVVNSVVFEPGMQHMDGERALTYSRLRPDGDFMRIERQQLVMVATAKKALGLGLLQDPLGTYRQYQDVVDTNLPDLRVPGIGLLAQDIGLDNVRTYSLACYRPTPAAECQNALTPFTTEDGAQVLLPEWDIVRAIIRQALPYLEGPVQAES